MPFRIEDELRSSAPNYVHAGPWTGFAIRDGSLVTCQQNFSGVETAAVMSRLSGVSV